MLAELLALISLAAPLAGADEQEVKIADTKIVVRIDSPWPNALNKGWLPLFVQIDNGEDHPQRVELHGECWGVAREISAEIEVPANQTSSIELLVPAFMGVPNSVMMWVKVGGKRQYCSSGIGAEEPAVPGTHAVLVLAAQSPESGTSERWTTEVSTGVAGAEQGNPSSFDPRISALRLIRSPTPAPATPNNIRVQAARFDQMPSRSEAYSSLDLVVLDLSNGLPEAQRLAPLIAWVKLGGTLLLVGPRAEALARSSSEFARWMEERFETNESVAFGSPGHGLLHSGWRMGLGSVFIDTAPALEDENQREQVRMLVKSSRGMVEDLGGSRMHRTLPVIPDLFSLPLKAFALFLVFFAVVIGPVNFLWVRRTKRPALLLFTIPLIAFVAALFLFLVGVLSQGLGVKIASQTFSLLDQREHRSSSAEQRMIFAGLSPGAGLVPGSGSSCYAIATYESDGSLERPGNSSRTYRIDQTDGLVLTGEFIPSRTAFVQQVLCEHAERARLAIKKQGEKFTVENGLGTPIRSLLLRDAAGGYHRLGAALTSGASAELEPIAVDTATDAARDLGVEILIPGVGELPPASYLAELERNPFGDDCGVSGTEVSSVHRLFGVLALDSEEWR